MKLIFSILILLSPYYSYALSKMELPLCTAEGEIVDVGAGTAKEDIYNENGNIKTLEVTYTRVDIKFEKDFSYNINQKNQYKCEDINAGEIRSYGLCENIDLVKGDVIKIKTEWSSLGTLCIFKAEILNKE